MVHFCIFFIKLVYDGFMAKRANSTLKTSRSHKTKKRLAVKRARRAAREAKK